jgi:hypothetical protein
VQFREQGFPGRTTVIDVKSHTGIDLKGWVAADVEALRSKLFSSVVDVIPTERWHDQVDGGGSSVAHVVLHLARHQDLAITTAIRNHPPLFTEWATPLGLGAVGHIDGASVSEREDRSVTAAVRCDTLVDYVQAVFEATTDWLERTGTLVLDTIPDAPRRLVQHAGLGDDFQWLHNMWADKPVWWLLQWPVIGHGHAHVGELISLRNRLGLSPF